MTKRSIFAAPRGIVTGIGKSTRKDRASALMAMSATALPDLSAAVPGKVGFHALSFEDFARVDTARTEFLNFLLAPAQAVRALAEPEVERAA